MERYRKAGKLGDGAYGVVYKAYDYIDNIYVALKKMRLDIDNEGIPQCALREFAFLKVLQSSNHPNIVRLLNVTFDCNKLYLAFELLHGDLKKLMDTAHPHGLGPDLVRSYTSQIFDGLAFIHSMGVMHRDLKPQNLLITRDGTIKIADFGLARSCLPEKRPLSIEVVTRWYRPPEILLGCDMYSCAVDVWSVGCIIAEMSNARPLFPSDSEVDQLHRIFKLLGTPTRQQWSQFVNMPHYRNTYPSWPRLHLEMAMPRLGEVGVDLVERIFRYEPTHRLSAAGALQHGYIKMLRQQSATCDYYPFTPPSQISQGRRESTSSGRTTAPATTSDTFSSSSVQERVDGKSPPRQLPRFVSLANVPSRPCSSLQRAPSFPLDPTSLAVTAPEKSTVTGPEGERATAAGESSSASCSDSEGEALAGESIAEGAGDANAESKQSSGPSGGASRRSGPGGKKRAAQEISRAAPRRSSRRSASLSVPQPDPAGSEQDCEGEGEAASTRRRKRTRK